MNPSPPIAIVGIGGIFPGALNPQQLWSHVLAGHSLSREVPPTRWPLSTADIYAPGNTPQPDKAYSKRACFIDPFTCDLAGLNISRDKLNRLDPMFHLLLHAGRAAWLDTITKNINPARAGIIIGNIALPTDAASALTDELLTPLFQSKLTRNTKHETRNSTDPLNRYVAGLPAGILAQALGLRGTAFTLDAACASSLYALKLAAEELLAGRADLMLTGGLSRPDSLYTQMGFSQLHALSPSGTCSPFDKNADGLVVGEGSGIFALKRLDDALRDGDHIYATIAAIGLSNDIAGNLMQPDSSGQLRAMRAAYQQAAWSPHDIDLIECHGTGTPVGDAVEFNSLSQLWQDSPTPKKPCVIGSVKSNVGHLLTAAGAAGLIKVLLAMRDQKLPPTANFSTPAPGIDLPNSPFTLLRESTDWPRPQNHPRRAAISGFGFGGINAHLLIQQWEDSPHPSPTSSFSLQPSALPPSPIAIVGIGAHFGPWNTLTKLKSRFFGNDTTPPTSPTRWWGSPESQNFQGYFIDEIKIPLGRFRIPPAELAEMLPQQLLMLQVAADAFDDQSAPGSAGGSPRQPAPTEITERLDTGVFIGIGLDLNTTNFRFRWTLHEKARRWARDLHLTPEQLADWTQQLRTAAGPALNANRTMGALGGIVASRVARAFHIGGPSFTLSSEESSALNALEVATRALQRHEINTALVGAVDLAGDLRAVLNQQAANPTENPLIGEGAAAFILKRHEDALRDGDHIYALITDIHSGIDIPPTSQPAQKIAAPELGHTGAASGIASLLKATLALHHQTLPSNSSPQHWLQDRAQGPRRATISTTSISGTSAQVTLQESPTHSPTPALPLTEHLLTLSAPTTADLLIQLTQLESLTHNSETSIATLAHQWFTQHPTTTDTLSLALITHSLPHLQSLLPEARYAISENIPLQTDHLFFNPAPLAAGNPAKIAFIYPGSGTQFPNMGRDLAAQFPQILHHQNSENQNLASQFAHAQLWSDTPTEISHRDAIFAHVSLGSFITDLLAAFHLTPDAVIGYSLGESTALFSTRTWRDRDLMLQRMHASSLFTTDLAGHCNAARRAWNLPDNQPVDWQVGVINRPADLVQKTLAGHDRVYLLIINTPTECVIGGTRIAVESLLRDLDNPHFHAIPTVTTVHCEVAKQVESAYRDLHLLPTTPPKNLRVYSSSLAQSYEVTPESAADSIVRQAVAPFDFTQVIHRAHADGIRFFIEVGPGSSCTRMIDQILIDKPHLARSACTPPLANQNNITTLLRLLATLISEGLRLDLSFLYKNPPQAEPAPATRSISVPTGGDPFNPPPPPSAPGSAGGSNPNNAHHPKKTPPLPQPTHTKFEPQPHPIQPQPSSGITNLPALVEQMAATQRAHHQAHESFLRLSQSTTRALTTALHFQQSLLARVPCSAVQENLTLLEPSPEMPLSMSRERAVHTQSDVPITNHQLPITSPPALTRAQCLEFATGSIAAVLGPAFAHIDAYPTRVRLPDEPLMLTDRILSINATPNALLQNPTGGGVGGSLVTAHDIHENAWYLDANRIPTCIAVEAGQADLFLSGYLGIDSITKGHAVYRLLDAVVTFHAPLPSPGTTILYDITIENFFRQGDTHLFRFHFDATINGQRFLTMTKGCAGFFSEAELAAGQGIVQTSIDKRPLPGIRPTDWSNPVPMSVESYDDTQLTALRNGNLAACFGPLFNNLPIENPSTLPSGRMTLVHRILNLDPTAGRYGIGQITGEADIRPDDWFLTCHFVDDRVMPGTLMYECCLHTLRVYLLRMGWVGESGFVACEPIPEIAGQLKCRGQVTASTKKVQYEVTLKEIGYQKDGTPYAIADALMYADNKPIVQMLNMSCQLSGLTKQKIESLWKSRPSNPSVPQSLSASVPLFDTPRITAFALGKPSEAFGAPYAIFDPGQPRKIARLPAPPYQFLDRITKIENCQPFTLAAGGVIEAEYDVPPDEWYFQANSQLHRSAFNVQRSEMPFSILLEAALQPCGWLAAYLGSALTSSTDLKFRNLGGTATQLHPVTPHTGTLTTTIKITNVSNSAGMLIQHFDMSLRSADGEVYKGTTYFGFFSKDALSNQIGIRDAALYQPAPEEIARATAFPYPTTAPFPDPQMRMVDHITHYDPSGGPGQLGFIRGTTAVNPDAWFFKAHFFEDPVWPGSLGLESFIQLLKLFAHKRWANVTRASSPPSPLDVVNFQSPAQNQKHAWIYRGQILPTDKLVTIEALITHIDDTRRLLRADGYLSVDNRTIYQMKDFTLTMQIP